MLGAEVIGREQTIPVDQGVLVGLTILRANVAPVAVTVTGQEGQRRKRVGGDGEMQSWSVAPVMSR
jgi:hypothetical protein